MVVDDNEFMSILKGRRVKLTLKTSSYLGVVQRINPNKTLVLAEVVNGSNGCKFPGSKMFFGHEILNVEFTDEANTESGNTKEQNLEDQFIVKKFQPYKKTNTLDDDDVDDDDEEQYIRFVVVDQFHEKFGPAVMHIKKQQVVGVGADGMDIYKHGRLIWLQSFIASSNSFNISKLIIRLLSILAGCSIATKNKVYLFDILLLGAQAFKNGLSMILESKTILKVIHDCRAVAGCLMAQFGVKLTNVFDTQAADVMCFQSETGGLLPDRVSTLQEVLGLHQKVHSSQLLSLQMKSRLNKEETEMWYKRPCPIPLLKVMAVSVIHLQPLRLVLLDNLMTDYMALVDSFLKNSNYAPDNLEHLSMESVLELPKEFRLLEQVRCDRQESATSRYPVTEEGLLARFNPRTSSQSTHATEELSRTHPESFVPATVELPSTKQVDHHQPPTNPFEVTDASSALSVDVHAPTDPTPQNPVHATFSDFRKDMSFYNPLSPGQGRACTELLMDMMGRGRPFGKEQSSTPLFNSLGRGFLFQIPPAQTPQKQY